VLQLRDGLGREVTKIGGKLFLTLKVTIAKNDGHDKLKSGLMQMARFETDYFQSMDDRHVSMFPSMVHISSCLSIGLISLTRWTR